jgi:hypothetical protein
VTHAPPSPPTPRPARETPDGRWFCERCGRRYPATGDCPHCDQEPLLDLASDHVRLALQEDLDRRKRHRFSTFVGLGIVVGVPVFFAVTFLLALGELVGLAAAAAATLAVATALTRLFPVRSTIPGDDGALPQPPPPPTTTDPTAEPPPPAAAPDSPTAAAPPHPAPHRTGMPPLLLALVIWLALATLLNVALVATAARTGLGDVAARVVAPLLLILGVLLGHESVRLFLIAVAVLQVGLGLLLAVLGFTNGLGLGTTLGVVGLLLGALPAAFMIWCLQREDTQQWMLRRSLGLPDEPR